jgi:hypothetical protein
MVHLTDHCVAVVVLEALDDPDLPEWFRSVEMLRHDARREAFELTFVSRLRQRRMAHMIVNVEMLVVDPNRSAFDRNVPQPLSIARNQMEPRADVRTNPVDVDPTVRLAQRTGVERRHSGHVHRTVRPLHQEE